MRIGIIADVIKVNDHFFSDNLISSIEATNVRALLRTLLKCRSIYSKQAIAKSHFSTLDSRIPR